MNYSHLPQLRTVSYYAECQKRFVTLAKEYEDILAIYSGGTVSQPGISDLDFMLCLKNTLTQPIDIENHLDKELANMISGGTIIKVNKANITNICVIDDFPLKLLSGKQYKFSTYSGQLYEVCRVLDWLPERLFTLHKLQQNKRIHTRRALQLLKSLVVSLEKLRGVIGRDSFEVFRNSVTTLRNEWFSKTTNENEQLLTQVLKDSLITAQEALNEMSLWIETKGLLQISNVLPEKKIVWRIPRGPVLYGAAHASIQEQRVYIPLNILLFVWHQSTIGNGFLARQLRNSFNNVPSASSYSIAPKLAEIVRARMEYVEAVAAFFRTNKLHSGLLKYGWYIK